MCHRPLASLVSLLLLALAAAPGVAAPQTRAQQKCLVQVDKGVDKLARAQAKENATCLKALGKGDLAKLGAASLYACTRDDVRGKVAKAAAKLEGKIEKRCAGEGAPGFGLPPTGAAQAGPPARRAAHGVLEDLLSPNLRAAAVPCDEDKGACRCQQKLLAAADKLAAAERKSFGKCTKKALSRGAESAADLAACLTDPATPGSLASAPKPVVRARAKVGKEVAKRCDEVAGHPLPGFCVGLSGDALATCVAERVSCRVCFQLRLSGGLDVDCDAVDDGQDNGSCPLTSPLLQETVDLPSPAQPAETPGTPGVVVTNPKLLAQFGGASFDLNRTRYTRYAFRNPPSDPPAAILVLVPGFEGGASGMKPLAENLLVRTLVDHGEVVEVWAYDRRSNQLEDGAGLEIAEDLLDPLVALDWLFGAELGLSLHPALVAGPNRRAEFYESEDLPFFASWTPLVFSQDIDVVVEAAVAAARNGNVFLGGHSAGTGFTARYAATDFDLAGAGPVEAGYAKLRGLVLLEGGGGSLPDSPPSEEALDRIEARFDGGLFGAVRDGAPRCVDGATPCEVATEAADCAAFANPRCVEPTSAFADLGGLLNPRLLAASEPAALQFVTDPDAGTIVLQADQGGIPGNNAVAQVPQLATLGLILSPSTAAGGVGSFLDDDGPVAGLAFFVATSVGAPGPAVDGLVTWQELDESTAFDASAVPDNGPAPTDAPAIWGREAEPVRLERVMTALFAGDTDFIDAYYPSSGLSVTNGLGGLDSTPLSVGRGRRDIENLTQAAAIDVPVIAFGGSNGLAPTPAAFLAFAESIAPCAAPSCDGAARVIAPDGPSAAFPTFGGEAGGFEVHVSEGYAHVDVIAADDLPGNEVIAPLAAFLVRNAP